MTIKKFQQNKEISEKKETEFDSKLLDVARTSRVTAGGKRMSFRSLVVVGNRNGKVGIGIGKANDVAFSIEKATHQAKRFLIAVPLTENGTIAHEVEGKYASARVLLKPSYAGKGIVAGGTVRVICDFAGIKNITAKLLSRTKNKINTAKATILALSKIRTR